MQTASVDPGADTLGAGAESRQPLGIAVVGGMLIGTLLSLYLIPACYTIFSGKKKVLRDDPVPPDEEPEPERIPVGAAG